MDRHALLAAYRRVRAATERLCEPLTLEDHGLQSMPDASPPKWHLGHTSWFFETFVLVPAGTPRLAEAYAVCFNSYYVGAGPRHPRPSRGLLSRPSLDEVRAYRRHVDDGVARLLEAGGDERVAATIELGLHHERQHQELLLTDVKHAFAQSPLGPAYRCPLPEAADPGPLSFTSFAGGLVERGAGAGFAFDHERPRHPVFVPPFRLGDRPVTVGEYLAFVEDGGYRRPELWLSAGFDRVASEGWVAPLYWRREGGSWTTFSLAGGRVPLDRNEPVCHVSHFEADAYARWAGARLPREEEWELAAAAAPVLGNLLEAGAFHPRAAPGPGLRQLFGDVWEWTSSAFGPYPGFRPLGGVLGEYNGKFMSGQLVLRGGSATSPAAHLRASYRNFFPPEARWQLAGIRLAADT